MSYDLKLTNPIDSMVIQEDHVIESDGYVVLLNKPTSGVTNVIVRINDFKRNANQLTEVLMRENVSDQFTFSNEDTINVARPPIYDGLKIGTLSTDVRDIIVKIKIEEEDVSEQFTGSEDWFIVSGRPILRSNIAEFNSLVTRDDVVITINGTEIPSTDIIDISASTGKIQLGYNPDAGDEVKITYFFRAAIKTLDASNGRIVLKEKPIIGTTVYVAYFARISNGWTLDKSTKSLYPDARDVVFGERRNVSRALISNEDVSSQLTGSQNYFYTSHKPLLPLYQDFSSTFSNVLNNAVVVTINGIREIVLSVDAITGLVQIATKPKSTDLVLVSYNYDNGRIPDRISVDYPIEKKYNSMYVRNVNLTDYILTTLGSYDIVQNEYKLAQDMMKIIITVRGSDPVATWYGTFFETIIGKKMYLDYVRTRVSGEIIEGLTRLKTAQIQQEEYQEVTDNEFLNLIQNIQVSTGDIDPTFISATVDVITLGGTSVPIQVPISTEGV